MTFPSILVPREPPQNRIAGPVGTGSGLFIPVKMLCLTTQSDVPIALMAPEYC